MAGLAGLDRDSAESKLVSSGAKPAAARDPLTPAARDVAA